MNKIMTNYSAAAMPKITNRKILQLKYSPSKKTDFKIPESERPKIAEIFAIARNELGTLVLNVDIPTKKHLAIAAMALGNIEFDIDMSTRRMEKVVEDSGIRFGISKFLETVF